MDQIPADYFKSIEGFEVSTFIYLKLMRHKLKAKTKLLQNSIIKLKGLSNTEEHSPPSTPSFEENYPSQRDSSLEENKSIVEEIPEASNKIKSRVEFQQKHDEIGKYAEIQKKVSDGLKDIAKCTTSISKPPATVRSIYMIESSEDEVDDLIEDIKEYKANLSGRDTKYDNYVYKDFEEIGKKSQQNNETNYTFHNQKTIENKKVASCAPASPVLDEDGFPVRILQYFI